MDDTTSETELLQASLTGDKEAFGLVVQRYEALVCALTYSATGDIGKSEELAQETFIRAWKGLRQLDSLGKFRVWLCAIARNLSHSFVRSSRRDVGGLDRGAPLSAAVPGPDEIASEKERREVVWNAVRRIDPKYREPLILFYRRQRSVSEVAADLDLSEDAVRQRLHRGRQLIRAELSSLVEETLTRSGPSKAFAVAVVAGLPALIAPPASAAVAGATVKGAPAAKTLVATGLSGAILGPILGLLGGVFGCWCSIKNTDSPRERRFVLKMVALVWVSLLLLVGVPLVLMLTGLIPRSSYWVCFTTFSVVLFPLILWGNARQRQIQIADGTYWPCKYTPRRITRSGVYGSFAGSTFGPSAWLLVLTWLARDWTSFAVIISCDIIIFWAATTICLRRPDRFWSAAFLAFSGLGLMTLAAVNLRWNAWMLAYRQMSSYDPINDVSLGTINLIIVGAYLALGMPLAWQHLRRREHGEGSGQDVT
ncbi:MAG: sigma-70 family RNA polymerase sigma factor [Sedimentisphaerales bacterium]|nr:sigma-70 family RNA polymerase sigma factor [Sedimentisphaerales bacterium]